MPEDLFQKDQLDMLSALLDGNVEFLLVGGLAMAAHGHARATKDMDIWVCCTPENVQRAWRAMAGFGAPLSDLTPEDLQDPLAILQIGVPPSRIDMIMSLEGVSFTDAWSRRIESNIGGLAIPTISRTDLIAVKRQAGRPQDLIDVQTLEHPLYDDPPPTEGKG